MKKIAIFILVIIGVVSTITYIYLNNIANYRNSEKENSKFEIYKNQEITGAELVTVINKAINSNVQNEIGKDNKGKYIDNGTSTVNMDIKFIDQKITYNIEKIYISGTENFMAYYRDIKFKCIETNYHKNGKVRYMLFEQITQ